MPERDANQLAADVRTAVMLSMTLTQPPPAQWTHDDYDRAMAALDELVGLVGTLQQERDKWQRVADDRLTHWQREVKGWGESYAALQQERDDANAECATMWQGVKESARRAEAAEAALAEQVDEWKVLADALDEIEQTDFTVGCSDGWRALDEAKSIARRSLAATDSDTKEPA